MLAVGEARFYYFYRLLTISKVWSSRNVLNVLYSLMRNSRLNMMISSHNEREDDEMANIPFTECSGTSALGDFEGECRVEPRWALSRPALGP